MHRRSLNLVLVLPLFRFSFLTILYSSPGQSCTQRVTSQDPEYDCIISARTDFGSIPTNAMVLHLEFTAEYAGVFLANNESMNLAGLLQLQELEIDLTYLARLRKETFRRLTQVKRLNLYHRPTLSSRQTYSLELDVGTFSELTGLTELSASSMGISNLPPDAFDGLYELKVLDLHLNSIEGIDNRVFARCCTDLFSLTLARNRLRGITGIQTLPKLGVLDLHGNNITVLPRGAFAGLSSLEDVNLASNNISHVEDGAFLELVKLQKLYLDKNAISEISGETFRGLANLTQLSLEENVLRALPSNGFLSLSSLTDLLVSNNQIQVIEPRAFRGLTQLLALNLDNNNITEINSKTFAYVSNVRNLYLMHNSISSITVDSFKSLNMLSSINLGANLLSTLSEGVFGDTSSLSTVNLSNNPWNCHCHLYWLAVMITEGRICNNSITVRDFNKMICHSPDGNHGKGIADAFLNTSCSLTTLPCHQVTTDGRTDSWTEAHARSWTDSPTDRRNDNRPESTSESSTKSWTDGRTQNRTHHPTPEPGVVDVGSSPKTLLTKPTIRQFTISTVPMQTTDPANSATNPQVSAELSVGQRAAIIIAACVFSVLLVLVTGLVTHRVLKHYSWWHISHRRDCVDGSKPVRTVSIVDIERVGQDNAGAVYDFNENAVNENKKGIIKNKDIKK